MNLVIFYLGLLGLILLGEALWGFLQSSFIAPSLLLGCGLIGWEPFLLRLILAPVARICLFLMGWKQLDPSVIQKLSTHPRVVTIFSHTGYSDSLYHRIPTDITLFQNFN
jgi:hypothetical protein